MHITPNTCGVCWKGQYVNGVCSNCHHKMTPPADRRTDALPLGAQLKQRYTIGEVLGNGGFGITYSVWDNVHNNRVALKELYPRRDVSRGEDNVTVKIVEGQEDYFNELAIRFENEANLLQSLCKECDVVKVYDLFHENGTVYYTMEYLDGCDLRSYLMKNGPMKWEVLQPKLQEVLQTLSVLHSKNLIHRDISPDNLFLTKDNRLRLIDFGSVRTYQGSTSFTVFLKQHFAPWEQYKSNGKQGPYTDIYALSVTMYMLLTAKLPPKAPDRMAGTQVIPLKTLCPTIPDRASKAIEKGMNLKAEERFQTADEFLYALTGTKPKPKTPKHEPPKPEPPKPEPPKSEPPKTPVTPSKNELVYWIHGRAGVYKDKRRTLDKNKEIRLGRLNHNDIPFPPETYGVSRNHCSVFINTQGDIFIKDNKSAYGTFLNNQKVGENWTKVASGSYVRLGGDNGQEIFQIYCTVK